MFLYLLGSMEFTRNFRIVEYFNFLTHADPRKVRTGAHLEIVWAVPNVHFLFVVFIRFPIVSIESPRTALVCPVTSRRSHNREIEWHVSSRVGLERNGDTFVDIHPDYNYKRISIWRSLLGWIGRDKYDSWFSNGE